MKRSVLVIAVVGLTQLLTSSFAQTNRFFYDNLGRLGVVLDASGTNAAFYNYDAVGNITSIVRQVVGPVNLFFFSPESGGANQTNTLQGTGFSVNPAQNTVVFGNVTAQVVAASANVLKVLVPTNATSSLIRVTTPSGSFTNARTFTANIAVSIAPSSATVPVMQSQQFTAVVYGTTNQNVTWNLNGFISAGTYSGYGMVSTNGYYTAPTNRPQNSVVIRARSVLASDSLADGVAPITISSTFTNLGPIYSPTVSSQPGRPVVSGPIWSPTVSAQSGVPPILGPIYSPTVSAGPQ